MSTNSSQYFIQTLSSFQSLSNSLPNVVKIGALNEKVDNKNVQQFKISKVVIHPEYKNASYYNDVALILLDKDVK